jgi:probable HAF family extracellular repeat protein
VAWYVNNNGWVAGWGDNDPVYRYSHAWVWTGSGALQNLGSFGGPQSVSIVSGLNDNNWIAGQSDTGGTGGTHGFLWTGGGTIQDIGGLGGPDTLPYGINNAGTIVGATSTPDGTTHGFSYSNGIMTDLGTTYIPTAINNSGQLGGDIMPSDGNFNEEHGFILSGGTYKDLGTLGGSASYVERLNDNGVAIGFSLTSSGQQHAFVFTDKMQDIGTLGGPSSFAYGINAAGAVVGSADFDSAQDAHAFIYLTATGMVDLNTLVDPALGLNLENAAGINSVGQIAVSGLNGAGEAHGFLLTPISVPEPSALLLSVAGGMVCFAYGVSRQ